MSFVYKQIVDNSEEIYRLKYFSVNLGERVVVEDSDDEGGVTSDEEFLYLNPNSETEEYDTDESGFHRLVEEFVAKTSLEVIEDCQGFTKPYNCNMKSRSMTRKSAETEDKQSDVVMSSDVESDAEEETKTKQKSNTRQKSKAKPRNSKGKSKPKKTQKRTSKTQSITESEANEEVEVMDQSIPEAGQLSKPCLVINTDEALLENDFFEHHMQQFLSQTMTPTQTSAMIQQTGQFSYIKTRKVSSAEMTLPKAQWQTVNVMIRPILDLFDEENHWPTILKTLQHSMFAFRKSSSATKSLGHRLLAHYDWNEDKVQCLPNELSFYQFLHNDILLKIFKECLLCCDYTRDDILKIIGGREGEANAWPFIRKLIHFIFNKTIESQKNESEGGQNCPESRDPSLATSHLQLIIDILTKDFEQFLNESDNYCNDIRGQNRPLISRVIWLQKSPDYLNSGFKQLIWLIVQVFKKIPKPEKSQLFVQLFRLFDLGAECLRIASGNVRPFLAFSLSKPMPTTELLQQLRHESMDSNVIFEKLLVASHLPWVTLQFCGLLLSNFIVELKTKYLVEKHRQISLKLVVESLTNARLTSNKVVANTPICNKTDQNSDPSSTRRSPRKRLSLDLMSGQQNKKSNGSLLRRNKYGQNPLHLACKKGDAIKVMQILEQSIKGFGPDPNDVDNAGYTPLFEAVIHNHVECVRTLIDWQKKADKILDFEAGPEKHTALHEAIAFNAIDSVKLIIESGGPELLDIRRKDDEKSPRDLIATNEMKTTIEMTQNQFTQKSLKITIDGEEDAKMFVKVFTSFISSYVKTTNINKFLEFNPMEPEAEPEVDQESWAEVFLAFFKRDISDTDVPFLIQELSIFLKLPKVVEHLKNLLGNSAKEEIEELEFTTDVLFRKKKLIDLFKGFALNGETNV